MALPAKRVQPKETNEKWMKSPSNFERLVLGCIDSYDSNQILILQHSSRSTIFSYFCTAQISKFQQKLVKIFGGMKFFFFMFSWGLLLFSPRKKKFISFHSRFSMNFAIFWRNLDEILPKKEKKRKNSFCRNFTEMFRKWQKFLEMLRKRAIKIRKIYEHIRNFKFPEFHTNLW